jgi:hypothetical protein
MGNYYQHAYSYRALIHGSATRYLSDALLPVTEMPNRRRFRSSTSNHRCKKRFLRFLFFPRFLTFFIFAKVFYYKKRWQNKNIDFMKPAE